jgi:Ca2+-binding RTX toxin-like protein
MPSTVANKSVTFNPTDSQATLEQRGVPKVVMGNTTIYVGTQQVSSTNQNPILTSFTNGKRDWVVNDYETGGADGRGMGLLWNGGTELYAAFTIDGTQSRSFQDNGLTQGWLKSYGSGGGAKVTVLVKLDPRTGRQGTGTAAKGDGTFVIAKLSDGKTNSLSPTGLDFDASGNVVLTASSYFAPLRTDGTRMVQTTPSGSPFNYRITFSPNLRQARNAVANGWDNGILASQRNDVLIGGAGNNTIDGLGGNDLISGFAGNDMLIGGAGNDTLLGAAAASAGANEHDILSPGLGADRIMLAESGKTYYTANGRNDYASILGFSRTEGDQVQLSSAAQPAYSAKVVNGNTELFLKTDLVAIFWGQSAFSLAVDAVFV